MSTENRLVFFSRCKPHGVDAIDIAREGMRVFIGYNMTKAGRARSAGAASN